MKCAIQPEPGAFAPRATRVDIGFDVVVRCAAREFEARITNISASGFRMRVPQPIEPGCEISVQSGKLPPMKAVVRWAAGNECGGSFAEGPRL